MRILRSLRSRQPALPRCVKPSRRGYDGDTGDRGLPGCHKGRAGWERRDSCGVPCLSALAFAGDDEAACEHPAEFDVRRVEAGKHISFGRGRHLCMGAPLVRAEAPVGLATLYQRLPDLRVSPGQALEYDPVLLWVMLKKLRVTWTAAPREHH